MAPKAKGSGVFEVRHGAIVKGTPWQRGQWTSDSTGDQELGTDERAGGHLQQAVQAQCWADRLTPQLGQAARGSVGKTYNLRQTL